KPARGIQVFWLVSANGLTETRTAIADSNGIASLELTLVRRVSVSTVEATLRRTSTGPSVTFMVIATAGRPTALVLISGANQTDTVTAQLSTLYAVQATDAYGNRAAGVAID